MSESRTFAPLSSGLLARKGQARPAMRPQGFGVRPGPAEDLGWNDMGQPVPPPVAPPAPSLPEAPPALRPEDYKAPDRPLMPLSRASGGEKAAFTLRLNGDRHLKLRLACALGNRSAQQIVIEALDAFLDRIPDLDMLAGAVPGETWASAKRKTKQGVKK